MGNIITLIMRSQPLFKASRWLVFFLLTLVLTTGWKSAQAITPDLTTSGKLAQTNTTPQDAPAELKNLLTQIDAAASQGDIKGVMQFYSPNFTHGDGLNRQTLEQSLISLWKRYPQLKYNTQLQSWKSEGNAIIADTTTTIQGLPSANSENLALSTTIKSRQRITAGKIVHQDILSERTQLTSGAKPPQIEMKLPEQVTVGQPYNLDAIVHEPLNDDYLLGTALEEPIQPEKYLNPTTVDLELLSSGGLFKEGRAPTTPGSQWVSAVIMRKDGMTMVTQRLRVVK